MVVPIDFSSSSDDAIQSALEITRQPGEVHVVHVALIPNFIPYAGEVVSTVDPKRWLHLARTHLADCLKSRPQFAGVCSKVLEGDVGDRIAKFAAAVHADLFVMPSHGYHGVKRFLPGFVTASVVRHSLCEVFVLKRPE